MMVLIGVILFGALAFTFARSARQGMSNVTTQEAGIAAGDVMAYARSLEQGINRMRIKGISESDLDFRGAGAAYNNAACSTDPCKVFLATGGQQVWQPNPGRANDGSEWIFTGAVSVTSLGNDAGDAASADLMMVLPNVNQTVCREINNRLGIPNPSDIPPVATGSITITTKYTGTFTAGSAIAGPGLAGKSTACYKYGTNHYFYQVLLAR